MGFPYVKNAAWVSGGAPGIDAAALNNLESQFDSLIALLTTRGDLTFRGAATWERLAKGVAGQVLVQGANEPAWGNVGLALCGDGSDGDVTIAADTDLSRDMYYNNLTVDITKTLSTKNYRIFVKDTLTNNGTISDSGDNGGNAASIMAGAGGVAPVAKSLGCGKNGAQGVHGGAQSASGGGGGGGGIMTIAAKIVINTGVIKTNGGNGGNGYAGATGTNTGGTNVAALSYAIGGNGGAGGASGSAGGTVGAITVPLDTYGGYRHLPELLNLRSPAGVLYYGGNGGASGAVSITPANVGGAGGGGGGFMVILYGSATWNSETASGGIHSNALGAAANGVDGSAGTVIKLPI